MNYLIDAHALLWHRNHDPRLSIPARAILEGNSGIPIISDVTFWEIAIKLSLGKLELTDNLQSLRKEWIGQEAAESLSIEWDHISAIQSLPLIHKDPFDRMLVAQALHENLTIVTCNPHIPKYPGVKTTW